MQKPQNVSVQKIIQRITTGDASRVLNTTILDENSQFTQESQYQSVDPTNTTISDQDAMAFYMHQ
jgi:hypothetical protein